MTSYSSLPNKLISAPNGVDYAYRDTGGRAPLVLLQHFRGNLDSWDPALIDALTSARRVVTFDNAGVGGSTGTTPDTVEQMAHDAIAFLAAMDLGQVDLLGFSIGSFVAQQIALRRPAIVRRLVLASAAPQGAAGLHGWAPDVIGAIGTPETSPEEYLGVFFAQSSSSRQAGKEALQRMYVRTEDRDRLQRALTDAEVETAIHYPTALPFLPCYQHRRPKPGDFTVAHCYQKSILSLPLFPELQDDAVAHVCAIIKKSFHG